MPTGRIFHVVRNFRSAAEAIDAGNYDSLWGLAEKPADIPLIIQPADCMVRAIPLDRVVKTEELFELYPRIMDPMTALAFGAKFPEEQRRAPHFTVWKDASGRFWCAVLNVNDQKRNVNVGQNHSGDEWRERCRILVR